MSSLGDITLRNDSSAWKVFTSLDASMHNSLLQYTVEILLSTCHAGIAIVSIVLHSLN